MHLSQLQVLLPHSVGQQLLPPKGCCHGLHPSALMTSSQGTISPAPHIALLAMWLCPQPLAAISWAVSIGTLSTPSLWQQWTERGRARQPLSPFIPAPSECETQVAANTCTCYSPTRNVEKQYIQHTVFTADKPIVTLLSPSCSGWLILSCQAEVLNTEIYSQCSLRSDYVVSLVVIQCTHTATVLQLYVTALLHLVSRCWLFLPRYTDCSWHCMPSHVPCLPNAWSMMYVCKVIPSLVRYAYVEWVDRLSEEEDVVFGTLLVYDCTDSNICTGVCHTHTRLVHKYEQMGIQVCGVAKSIKALHAQAACMCLHACTY